MAYATSIVIEEMKRIAAEPVTPEELENAKTRLHRPPAAELCDQGPGGGRAGVRGIHRPLPRPIRITGSKVVPRIRAVTREDVQRVAKKYLTPDRLVILGVGQKDEILKGDPNHPVAFTNLVGGKFTELAVARSADDEADAVGSEVNQGAMSATTEGEYHIATPGIRPASRLGG